MRIFITLLILIFSIQSWTRANDISDFQIEGMSIGDSLLDYYDANEIEINKRDYYVSPEFVAVKMLIDSEQYHFVDIHYKKDSNFIIHSVDGIFNIENIDECRNKIKNIDDEFSKIFTNSKKGEWIEEPMFSKDGHLYGYYYLLKSGDWAEISCYKFKSRDRPDHGRVSLYTKEFDEWMKTVQYK